MALGENCNRHPNLLRKYRKVRGLSQKKVAQILGLKSSSRISRWENGKAVPSLSNAMRLAALYRVMVDALFIDNARCFKEEITKVETDHLEEKKNAEKGEQ